MKTTVDKRDVTESVQLLDRWTLGRLGRMIAEMPTDRRFDYEFRLIEGGIHLFLRDQDEGKVG